MRRLEVLERTQEAGLGEGEAPAEPQAQGSARLSGSFVLPKTSHRKSLVHALGVSAILCAFAGCQSPPSTHPGPDMIVTYRDDGSPNFAGIQSQTQRHLVDGVGYETEVGADGQPATGPHIVLGPGGRVLSLVVYEQGKPVTAWSGYGGRWEQRMMQGTGWIDSYDPDGNLHESYHYANGEYTHGVH